MTDPYEVLLSTYRPIHQLIPPHWQSAKLTLDDGGTLHYLRTGGYLPPIILLHGFQVDGSMWLRTALELSDRYDCIMPDMRGHGLSSMMPDTFDDGTLMYDITQLIEVLHIEQPAIFIGHSMGAEVAIRLAGKMSAKQLILVDPALRNFSANFPLVEDGLPDYMQPIVETINMLRSLTHHERLLMGLSLVPPGTSLWGEYDYVAFVEGQKLFDMNSYLHSQKMRYMIESPDLIASVSCHILLMTARPMMMPTEFEEAIHIFTNNWQAGRHIHFDNSGHFIPFDQFDIFIEAVQQTLQLS